MGKIQKRCDKLDSDKEDNDFLSPLENKFSGKKYPFKSSYPGSHVLYLAELKLPIIPKLSLPGGKLCDIELLKWTKSEVDEMVQEKLLILRKNDTAYVLSVSNAQRFKV